MENILEKCEIVLYADDTLIFTDNKTDKLCHENLTMDMENTCEWLMMNKLKLNENKTKSLEINMDNNIIFKINNVMIEKVNSIKYLDFIIDKELKFNGHMEFICKKIGEKIGFFKRIRNKMSITTSINIYNTIIKPHFKFGSTIPYSSCSDRRVIMTTEFTKQCNACNVNRVTSTRCIIDTLKWLNIKERQVTTIFFFEK